MKLLLFGLMIGLVCAPAGIGVAEEPAAQGESKPAEKIQIPADETPKQALLRGCNVEEQLDLNADMELYDYSTPLEKDLVQACCKYYVSLTRVELAVRKQFGRKQEDEMLHGIGENTEEDAKNAEYKVDGDKTTVKFPGDQEPSVFMIRVKGVWKLDIQPLMKSADEKTIRDWIKGYEIKARDVAPVAEKIKQGGYKNIDDVVSDLKRVVDSN